MSDLPEQNPSEDRAHKAEPQQDQANTSKPPSRPSGSTGSFTPDQEPPHCAERGHEKDEHTLCQRFCDDLGKPSFLVSLLTLLWIAIYTAATLRLVGHSQDQITLARSAFEVQLRPWIVAETNITAPLIIDDKEAVQIGLSFAIRNIGKSVARNVILTPVLRHFGSVEDSLRVSTWQTEACETAEMMGSPPNLGVSIFPDETIEQNVMLSTHRSALGMTGSPLDTENKTFLTPIVIVCIDYQFPFDPPLHHATSYIFHLYRHTEGKPRRAIEFRPGTTPRDELRLEPFFISQLERRAD